MIKVFLKNRNYFGLSYLRELEILKLMTIFYEINKLLKIKNFEKNKLNFLLIVYIIKKSHILIKTSK